MHSKSCLNVKLKEIKKKKEIADECLAMVFGFCGGFTFTYIINVSTNDK